jgi:hypothetical protein
VTGPTGDGRAPSRSAPLVMHEEQIPHRTSQRGRAACAKSRITAAPGRVSWRASR